MRYDRVTSAVFLSRPNRFIARVLLPCGEEIVHVKNTGRCRELLVPGCRVYLAASLNPARKTRFDLIAVEKERPGKAPLLINMDAQAPNAAVGEFLRAGGLIPNPDRVQSEVRYGASRFDFYAEKGERRAFLEVKGVTLEEDG
ncbi:MAG: DNA/RNA nuclease SfsA, partial [Clostridia bacterium]|nr:DNA/RNA nuclease SfsA [Clostridia bacterium]